MFWYVSAIGLSAGLVYFVNKKRNSEKHLNEVFNAYRQAERDGWTYGPPDD